MSVNVFDRQIRYLCERYVVIPLGELVEKLSTGPLDRPYIAITVDDGYRDFAEYAYPVLEKYRVPATVYLVSGFVDKRYWLWFDAINYIAGKAVEKEYELSLGKVVLRATIEDIASRQALWENVADMSVSLDPPSRAGLIEAFARQMGVVLPSSPTPEYCAMSWDTIRSLDPGLIEWGGHTVTHPTLSSCGPDEQQHEIRQGRVRVQEMTQQVVDSFCYPNGQSGDYDRYTVEAVKSAGFRNAVVSHGGMARAGCDPYVIERLGAPDNDLDFYKCIDGVWEARRRIRQSVSGLCGRNPSSEEAPTESGHKY